MLLLHRFSRTCSENLSENTSMIILFIVCDISANQPRINHCPSAYSVLYLILVVKLVSLKTEASVTFPPLRN